MLERWSPWLYLVALAATNIWIIRESFVTESTAHWQSMHGYWMGMARAVDLDWLPPHWWQIGGGGAPLEYLYNPLVPALTAGLSHLLQVSIPLAFHILSGAVYVGGPLTLYVVSWKLLRSPGYSFVAAMVYTLLSTAPILAPDEAWRAVGLFNGRRMFLIYEWDDLPHALSLALLPLAVYFLGDALRSRRFRTSCLAGLMFSLMMLSNMFGLVLTALAAITVPVAMEPRRFWGPMARSLAIATGAWFLVMPWVPPSLLMAVQYNATIDGERDTPLRALMALGVVAGCGVAVLWLSTRRETTWPMRWLLLFACPAILIPVIAQYWGPHFVPQPSRYKMELELLVAWLGVFALRPLVDRCPAVARGLLIVVVTGGAVWAAQEQRTLALDRMRGVNVPDTLEYRVAKWVEANLPGQRVMMTGSMAQWLTLFTNQPQVSGQSYSTALNFMEQVATYVLYSDQGAGEKAAEYSLLWLQAVGAQAVAVPGPNSPDAWKPFQHPKKFEGLLPVMWRDMDTTIYRVPQRSTSLAHAVPRSAIVAHAPIHGLDLDEVRVYVDALEDPGAPETPLEWKDRNTALVRGDLRPTDTVSLQLNYHPGWHATVNGQAKALARDGIGLMFVEPNCAGTCEIELHYDGGLETQVALGLSAAMLLVIAGGLFTGWRADPASS